MKAIRLLLSTCFACFAISCINDLGNYDYISEETLIPVTISGYGDTTAVIGEMLEIVPELSNMDDESRYVYLWYASIKYTQGTLPKRDTLSLERNLSVQVKMAGNIYNLVFEVRDPVLDVYVSKRVDLSVTANNFTTGWYILKTVDNETDIDYVALGNPITIPNLLRDQAGYELYHNGPIEVGNQQLKGKARKLVWQNQSYNHIATNEDGTAENLRGQKAYHIMSDQDFKTFNSNNLYLFKTFQQAFYEPPQPDPQNVAFFSPDLFFINAGKLHTIYGMSLNAGMFPFPKTCSISPNYQLHPDMMLMFYGGIFFDTVTRSFLQATAAGTTLNKFAEPPSGGLPSLTNMEYELVGMFERIRAQSNYTAYFLMKHISNGKYYLAFLSSKYGEATQYPFESFNEIPSNAKLPEADVFGSPRSASCVYFGKANVLSYYLDASDVENKEKVIKTFPSDETIVYISDVKSGTLTVLTNSPAGWKLYGFPIIGATSDINPKEEFIFEGKGEAHSLLYRSF